MRRALIALISVSALSGCGIVIPSHAPVAPLNAPAPELPPGQTIVMGIKDNLTSNAPEWVCSGYCGIGKENAQWSSFFVRELIPQYPFLKNPVPFDQRTFFSHDYVLTLDINNRQHHWNLSGYLSLFTLGLFPEFGESEFTVTARLTSPGGKTVISEHSARRTSRSISHLLFIFYAPFEDYVVDWRGFIEEVSTDPLNQVSNDLKDYLAKQAASPELATGKEHN